MKKTAVVLFNIGGPDKTQDVRKFLLNFFSDRNIIALPNPFRKMLAILISSTRYKESAKNYFEIHKDGGSPLLQNTKEQMDALENSLGDGFKVFICMRYWHPFTCDVVKEVLNYAPDEVVLLPLYPQYSFATTRSSFEEWYKFFPKHSLIKQREIVSYHNHPLYIESWCNRIRESLEQMPVCDVILFSAHGIPVSYVKKGDPYQRQIKESVELIMKHFDGHKFTLCYQSRVGKLEWLRPYFSDEIENWKGKKILVVPISFVSEHVETLFELDIEYREVAEHVGVLDYKVCKTPGENHSFISCLKDLVKNYHPII